VKNLERLIGNRFIGRLNTFPAQMSLAKDSSLSFRMTNFLNFYYHKKSGSNQTGEM
jgi:hypothetical protein